MMRRSKTPTTPIMTPAEERFMAFEGLVQWTQSVASQSTRVSAAAAALSDSISKAPDIRRRALLALQTECHFFAIAAHKLIEFLDWSRELQLCDGMDLAEIDSFDKDDICDLRNMREHVTQYFKGNGHFKPRWAKGTPQFSADASSIVGNLIGGRLDWVKFGGAATRLLDQLNKLPIPYSNPPHQ